MIAVGSKLSLFLCTLRFVSTYGGSYCANTNIKIFWPFTMISVTDIEFFQPVPIISLTNIKFFWQIPSLSDHFRWFPVIGVFQSFILLLEATSEDRRLVHPFNYFLTGPALTRHVLIFRIIKTCTILYIALYKNKTFLYRTAFSL